MEVTFGDILQKHRACTGETQGCLAEKLGISRGYLSSIECGKANNLSYKLALKLLNLSGLAHGQVEVTLPRKVFVDATIATEIVWLNEAGVATVTCCVGPPATALIGLSSARKARALGYDPQYREDIGLFQIKLRSKAKGMP